MEILQEDKDLVVKRLEELKQELRELATEFHQTLTESSETWHDNSPWENAKQRERGLLAEQENLERVIKNYSVVKDDDKSPIGKNHEVEFNGNKVKVFLAGDFSMRTGEMIDGCIVVTKDSPIARELLKA